MTENNTNNETALAPMQANERGLILTTSDDLQRFARMVSDSHMAPNAYNNNIAAIAIGIQYGAEIGLRPMQALQAIAVINGRPCLWGDAMLGLVRKSGFLKAIDETITGKLLDMEAQCTVTRENEDPKSFTFSWKQATTAGLISKDVWRKYPERMLKFRARSYALRDTFGDVLMGIGSAEEMRDIEVESETIVENIESQKDELVDAMFGDKKSSSLVCDAYGCEKESVYEFTIDGVTRGVCDEHNQPPVAPSEAEIEAEIPSDQQNQFKEDDKTQLPW